jgi:HAE1 family hydrophobic/amphiphilic exporter-1
MLEDRGGHDVQYLADNVTKFIQAARQRPELASVSTTLLSSAPQVFVRVERDKALAQGVNLSDVYQTLQAFMGGAFINYFNRFGRQWQVYIQAEGDYRTRAENLGQFYVRNSAGGMVPLSSVTSIENRVGPEFTLRYNLYRCAQINASAATGRSSAQAMAAMEEVFAQTMPADMGFDYMGMSYQEKKAQQGVSPAVIFGFSTLFCFLILAALYESWTLPFSVLLSVPVAVFGAFAALYLRRFSNFSFENNVYAQIGLVMLIGLAAKNAILIVEFAKASHEQGKPLVDAALEGAKLRLRPILMTSLAFILGCIPLWIASGSGAVSRQVMGTAVIGGMTAASGIAIFIIPALFFIVEKLGGSKQKVVRAPLTPSPQSGAPAVGDD